VNGKSGVPNKPLEAALRVAAEPPSGYMARSPSISRREIAFIESIDACFPYGDEVAARASVCEAAAISDNAALMVAHELAFAPDSIAAELRLTLLDLLVAQRPSGLVMAAKPVVQALILGERPSKEAADLLLLRCRSEPISFNALNILSECSPECASLAEEIRNRA
jgi:hypothetical protein